MKTNKFIIVIILLFLFGRCANDSMIEDKSKVTLTVSSGACFPEVSDKYVYPIVPGMIEWQTAKSTDEIYEFCQLPDSILKSISTPGLIDALIHAPMFTGFYLLSSNSSALKWHGHYGQFNSAKELFQRKDAGDALTTYYKLVSFDCITPPFGASGDCERIMGLECLFTKQEILDKIEHTKRKEAVAALLTNYEQYPDNVNIIFPMAYIMFTDKYAPIMEYYQNHTEKFQYILTGHCYSLDQIDIIVSFAQSFTKNKK